ncbi:proline iminopeptidase-family hydrolase [Hymenobacter sp. BT683]|uniref:Proline iminopeptidase-family hydrolase n=1 Tax=Hymenobacter jeongseonensis TaxID=2791027 RepID=A0ABS0IMY8_9BACT|nr:proline iminopeptidase-family hydrolase [Hymenobacter jeongseonensis]MBF9239718.1 proline iminopeptidase-family hydrolase [Hymenobacter jeongseonensis]
MKHKSFFGLDRHLLAVVFFWLLALTLRAQTATKEGFIDVPGGKVWYQILGADKPGVPLLVLHGGPGSGSGAFGNFTALADERPVILYDQLGCGKSDRPDNPSLWTLGRYVEELDVVVRTLGYPKLHLLGHSWGTTLATEYVLTKNPPQVVSLIESSPWLDTKRWLADARHYVAELPPATRAAFKLENAPDSASRRKYQQAVDYYYSLHVWRNRPAVLTWERGGGKQAYETMWGKNETTSTGNMKNHSRTAALKNLTLPVLYLCGRYDEATPTSTAFFQKRTPNSQLVVFENASHTAYREVPNLYFKTVREFLRQH